MSNKKSTKNSNDNEKTKRVDVVKEKDINKKNKDKKFHCQKKYLHGQQ